METILVPTDFSENAQNALDYAVMMAEKTNAAIILINAYHLAMPDPFFPWTIVDSVNAGDLITEKLQKLCQEVMQYKKVKCSYIQEYGETVQVISSITKEKNIDLVVMGTRGANKSKGDLLGGNTKGIISKSNCPVIAVPENYSSDKIQKITYATDYHNSDLASLKYLSAIAKSFMAEVNIVHVSTGEFTEDAEKIFMDKFVKNAVSSMNYSNVSFEILKGDDVSDILSNIVENKKTDILITSTKKRGIFDRLLTTSVTKSLVSHLTIPLMVFHYKEDSTYFLA